MKAVNIRLDREQQTICARLGILRNLYAIEQGNADLHGHKGPGWNIHIEACGGECAFGLATGLSWPMTLNTYKEPDFRGKNNEPIQVRTRLQHSYELIVREDDNPEELFVLVTGQMPVYRVVGWIGGYEARQSVWRRNHGGREWAWFVPHAALRPMVRSSALRV
jgi:hypothetical protein